MDAYKTLRFGPGEIPKGLLKEHSLKAGVHAQLEVEAGQLVFVDDHEGTRTHLSAGDIHPVGSNVHHLEEAQGASIEIRFFRDEKNPAPAKGLRPFLVVDGDDDPIAYYEAAFGAECIYVLRMPDGRIGHAELEAFGERFVLSHAFAEMNVLGPGARGGTTVSLGIYIDDVDAAAERALAAGVELERPIRDEFFGDRVAMLRDRYGHRWHLQMRQEDVSPEEMQSRLDEMMGA